MSGTTSFDDPRWWLNPFGRRQEILRCCNYSRRRDSLTDLVVLDDGKLAVICPHCKTRGTEKDSKESAVIAWNGARKKEALEASLKREVESLRRQQADRVLPMIGNLLDHWDQLPLDLLTDPDMAALAGVVDEIESGMEGVGNG